MILCCGNAPEAEDICAEAFLRAWKSREQFQGELNMALSWVLRIARNLYIDRQRGATRQLAAEELEGEEGSADPTPEESLLACERSETLLAGLGQLSAAERELLYLRYGLGWHVNQAALQLGLKENTAAVTLRRALARLRTWLETKEETQA